MTIIERVMRAEFLAAEFRRAGAFGLADLMGRCSDMFELQLRAGEMSREEFFGEATP